MASSIPAGGSGGGRGDPVNIQATRVAADISVGHHQPSNMPATVSGQQSARTASAGDLQAVAAAARGPVDPQQQQQLQQTGGRGLELHPLPGRIDEGVLYGGSETMTFQQEVEDAHQPRKKTTSFKITNVFLSRPPSNDGDESNEELDDLEDSHTEDLSEMADSLSSQLEPLAAAGAASGQPGVNGVPQGKGKPVTPGHETRNRKFSQEKGWEQDAYHAHPGFGFVTYNQDAGYQVSYVDKTTGQLPIAGTMAVIVNNNSEQGSEVSEVPVSGPQDFKNRFKIVKVETTEPLKRGRWTCFDFVDKPASKDKVTGTSEPEKQVKTTTTGGGPSGAATMSYAASHTATVKTNSTAPHGGSRPASVAANLSATINVAPAVAVSSSVVAGGGTAATAVGGGLEQLQQSAGVQQPQAAVASIQQTSAAAANAMADSNFADELQQQGVESSAVTGVGRQPSGGDPGPAGQRSGHKSGGGPSNGLASYSNHPSHSIPTQQNISSLSQVQSPSGMAAQLLGQVIRLPDGQLAQVALAPFSVLQQQTQQGGGNANAGANFNNQTIVLQPINPAQSNLPHKGVVMNSGGQLIVGSIVQGQQNTPSQNQTMGATSGGQQATGGGQPGPANSQQQQASGQQPTPGQQPGGQQPSRQSAQSKPSGNGSILIQHSGQSLQQGQGQQGLNHQTQQNLQHSQIQTLSPASSQPSQQQQLQAAHSAAQVMSHMPPAGASIPQMSQSAAVAAAAAGSTSGGLNAGGGGVSQQLPPGQMSVAASSSSQQNVIHSGQQQSQNQQHMTPGSAANHIQQQHTLQAAVAAGAHQQQIAAASSQPQQTLSNSNSSNHQQTSQQPQQQQSVAGISQQQQAGQQQQAQNSLQQQQQQYSQQVPVVVSLQQSQQNRASQHQFNSTTLAAASVIQQQQQQSLLQQQQQPQQMGILHQFSAAQPSAAGSPSAVGNNGAAIAGYPQLINNQLSSQQGNIHNVSVSVQNSKQTSNNGGVITNNGGVITLAGYTAANLPPLSTLTPLVQAGGVGGAEVGGGEGLVEQLEISLLQDGVVPGGDGSQAQQDPETDSSTGSGQGTIDNRIEQAMDLVKSHLMSAVRSEVEELRDKITKLEESVTVLSRENEYLRANVNQDVLASLSGVRPHQPPDNNHQ